MTVSRRSLLAAGLATPFLRSAASAQKADGVLRVVPHADLRNIDPIWTTAYITRNHGYMVYDTLFALDADLNVRPQMVESWDESGDRKTWTFVLREGLRFSDGTGVTAQDCVASLVRWSKRDGMGQALAAAVEHWRARDERTFEIVLRQPYPMLLDSLGKLSSNVPFIIPQAAAATDPSRQIENAVGSGPFVFKRDEWAPGSKVVYVKNPHYVPRQEAPSGAAGGKVVKVERVEWLYMPDPTTAMNALMAGEIDYLEQVPADLAPLLANAPNVKVEVLDPLGTQAMLRFNHQVAPTNNMLVRRAIMRAIDQKEALAAGIGNPQYFKECRSVFPCGTKFASDAGEAFAYPADKELARKILRESGYKGERLVILQPTDVPIANAFALVAGRACRDIGINVDVQAMDWSTITSRRARRESVEQGGWNMFPSWWIGGDLLNPISNLPLVADPERAWAGWPNDAELEQLRARFAQAETPKEQKNAAAAVQARALEIGTAVNLGTFFIPVGYRTNVRGMIRSPVPFFWNIEKS